MHFTTRGNLLNQIDSNRDVFIFEKIYSTNYYIYILQIPNYDRNIIDHSVTEVWRKQSHG